MSIYGITCGITTLELLLQTARVQSPVPNKSPCVRVRRIILFKKNWSVELVETALISVVSHVLDTGEDLILVEHVTRPNAALKTPPMRHFYLPFLILL